MSILPNYSKFVLTLIVFLCAMLIKCWLVLRAKTTRTVAIYCRTRERQKKNDRYHGWFIARFRAYYQRTAFLFPNACHVVGGYIETDHVKWKWCDVGARWLGGSVARTPIEIKSLNKFVPSYSSYTHRHTHILYYLNSRFIHILTEHGCCCCWRCSLC